MELVRRESCNSCLAMLGVWLTAVGVWALVHPAAAFPSFLAPMAALAGALLLLCHRR